jgi:hypothetical protein
MSLPVRSNTEQLLWRGGAAKMTFMQQARLQARAELRKHNHERPRCAGCGGDLLIFTADDFVTAEQYADPHWTWLRREDFRPGDLLCFWCSVALIQIENQFVWGSV